MDENTNIVTEPRFLGWENDWADAPPTEVKHCREQHHQVSSSCTPDCVHTIACELCGIYWKRDSGD